MSNLSESITINGGGLYTRSIAAQFGVTRAKAWRVMRGLELRGFLTGEARGKGGDYVDRRDDGKPATVGAEILWFATSDHDGPSADSEAAALAIVAAFAASE